MRTWSAPLRFFVGKGMREFGSLSDRGYRRGLLTLGILGTPIHRPTGFCFSSFWSPVWDAGAFHPAAIGLTGSLSASRKGMLIGIFASGGAAGFGCSQLVYTWVYEGTQGQTIWLAIPSLLLIFVLLFYMSNVRPYFDTKASSGFQRLFQSIQKSQGHVSISHTSVQSWLTRGFIFCYNFVLSEVMNVPHSVEKASSLLCY